jgi:hypothetical protein
MTIEWRFNITGTISLVLIVCKLIGAFQGSWWLVFAPVLLALPVAGLLTILAQMAGKTKIIINL